MKTLEKAFDILELVASSKGNPVSPKVASETLNINAATCVRFMKQLAARGYLEQFSRRSGYVAGPAVLTFTDRKSRYSRIVEASYGPVKKLSHNLKTFINISVLYRGMRYLLYSYSSHTRESSGTERLAMSYDVATGRLLLSACSPPEREAIITGLGMPGKLWKNIKSRKALNDELEKTRKSKCISFPDPRTGQWILGGLVLAEGYPPAAIGFGIEDTNPKNALKHTRTTVKEIENNLNKKDLIY